MLAQKIDEDLKAAMKARNNTKVGTLRMLKAALHNYLIDKRKDSADDAEVISIIQKQLKLRVDSIEQFKKGNREDLVEKESSEKAVLETYLPPPLNDEELETLIRSAIVKTGARSKADLGRVMKEALAQAAGRADGGRLSAVAGSLLK